MDGVIHAAELQYQNQRQLRLQDFQNLRTKGRNEASDKIQTEKNKGQISEPYFYNMGERGQAETSDCFRHDCILGKLQILGTHLVF